MVKKSININFYSGRQWAEPRLMKEYPATNYAWHIGRHEDVAYERYIVLDETIYTKQKTRGIDDMLPWRKNENDKTKFKWSDTEPVYDLTENLEYQFRWTTVAGKRVKLWRKKP